MTDNDIIKALENCKNNGDCKDCILNPHVGNYGYCTSIAIEAALDLINRQKAEIERLKNGWRADVVETANAKSEAIKEFAERLKESSFPCDVSFGFGREHCEEAVTVLEIDNLVKEMTEETP